LIHCRGQPDLFFDPAAAKERLSSSVRGLAAGQATSDTLPDGWLPVCPPAEGEDEAVECVEDEEADDAAASCCALLYRRAASGGCW
jgi:hypothetical protein